MSSNSPPHQLPEVEIIDMLAQVYNHHHYWEIFSLKQENALHVTNLDMYCNLSERLFCIDLEEMVLDTEW